MIENGFEPINHFLHTHPHWIAYLGLLLRLKCGLLTVLMGYFLYRVYTEPAPAPPRRESRSDTHFLA
ncbi:hypothetical protein SAMN02949497_4742 [Methylomagnum ishizawai]|uniref:Uncharacterized protein n=1 Tax=Methylomagnum ishizawai TaxID=1760988 RepID=A0A1Y6CSV3_9GAMM|nr:hypothetical protein [Methylomagnum ishizawai]SMF93280.1 hypothetical protein SAMN02949497_0555 [Methylomagnum ishizawai]SMF97319.1 hypothetical protein SAMN02949497_4742 [Methylomagnum ishizawai]